MAENAKNSKYPFPLLDNLAMTMVLSSAQYKRQDDETAGAEDEVQSFNSEALCVEHVEGAQEQGAGAGKGAINKKIIF